MQDPQFLHLVSGRPPRPPGSALRASDVPDDLLLRSASAPQRERLLVGLALTLEEPGHEPLREVLRRVAREANALALEQTLEFSARQGTLGFVVETLGLDWLLALGEARGVAVNDVLATSDTVSERGLTRTEATRLAQNFAHTLDPRTVRFRFTTGVQTMGAGALVLGNTIHVDPTDPRWALRRGTTLPDDPHDEAWDSFNGVLLAHEPSHVWSYQHQGSRYAVNSVTDQLAAMQSGNRSGAYLYKPDRGHFLDYGEEQRAMIVQDFVAATRARQQTSFTLYGGTQPVAEVLRTLTKYIDQMRSAGPGLAEPVARQPEWIVCACFAQDGLLGTLGRQGDALVGAAGRVATQAVVGGLTHRDPALFSAGVAGVTAALAASAVAREQSGAGATSGGSALLDQAGIPRGVALGAGGLEVSAKAAWDAPVATSGLTLGAADPRVEWNASLHRDVGQARVDADANAVIARSGEVREADVAVRVEQGGASLSADVGMEAQQAHAPQRAWAQVALVTAPVSVSAGGQLTSRGGVVQSVTAQAAVEAARASVSGDARFVRAHADAPLALDEATVRATLSPSAGTSVGLKAKLVPAGLDELAAELATVNDAGSLALAAEGTKLTTTPTVGVSLTATEKKSGVAVSVNAQSTPSTGEAEGGVSVSIPLPEPGTRR